MENLSLIGLFAQHVVQLDLGMTDILKMQALAGRIARACVGRSKSARLAGYSAVMADVGRLAQWLFPGIEVRISEIEAPFRADPALLPAPEAGAERAAPRAAAGVS